MANLESTFIKPLAMGVTGRSVIDNLSLIISANLAKFLEEAFPTFTSTISGQRSGLIGSLQKKIFLEKTSKS